MLKLDFGSVKIADLSPFITNSILSASEKFLKEYKEELRLYLSSLLITKKTMQEYPFLKNIPKFIDNLLDCFVIRSRPGGDKGTVSIEFDQAKAVQKGFPKNIPRLVEYGSSTFPKLGGGSRGKVIGTIRGGPLCQAVDNWLTGVLNSLSAYLKGGIV